MIVREILALFCVCLAGCFAQPAVLTADGAGVDSGTDRGKGMDPCGSCEAYCSLTYPEHTYPRPLDSSACRRGCRLAQIESLIVWPFNPQKETCTNTCKEAYSSSSPSEQYACLVGCNATTITSVFADTRTNTGSMMDSLQGMLHLMVMSSTDQDSSSQQDMDTLNQQAEILLPVSSSVSIVSKDEDGEEIISFTSYRIGDNAPPFKLTFESNDDSSDNDVVVQSYFDKDTGTGSSHFFQCFWRRQSLFGRIMMVFSLGFIIFAILTCCFATCGNSTEEENESHLKEKSSKPRSMKQVVMPGDVKVPLELTSEFTPYRLPVVLQGDKRVEGILTVI